MHALTSLERSAVGKLIASIAAQLLEWMNTSMNKATLRISISTAARAAFLHVLHDYISLFVL